MRWLCFARRIPELFARTVAPDRSTDESLLQGGSPGWRPWLACIAVKLRTRMREARERRRSIAALRALDDRTLKDMGLERHQIEPAVTYGRP